MESPTPDLFPEDGARHRKESDSYEGESGRFLLRDGKRSFRAKWKVKKASEKYLRLLPLPGTLEATALAQAAPEPGMNQGK